jgi:hypothetical protein
MKNINKIVLALLMALLVVSLAGCDGGDEDKEGSRVDSPEVANAELHQAQTAIDACMADAGVATLSSYSNTTGWDGSRGVIQANGCDAADYLHGTFKAHYLVNENGDIVGAINDAWRGLRWDNAKHRWTYAPFQK